MHGGRAARRLISGRGRLCVVAAATFALMLTSGDAMADTPTPTPEPSISTPTPPAESSEATPSATPTVPDRTPSPSAERSARSRATALLSLSVASQDGPVAGRFYQDFGFYALTGDAAGLDDGSVVEIYRRTADSAWAQVAEATLSSGRYEARLPVYALGTFTFAATTGGAPGSGDELSSNQVTVTVEDSKVALQRPVAKIDSLKNPTIRGTVVPAHAGVEVQVEVLRSGTFTPAATAKTDATGAFALSLGYGKGRLAAYQIRARYRVANRDRWEVSGSQTFARIAVLNPVVTPTTAAEVAETYRSGCPVGPSKLQTVRMNYYGRDKKMHRGLLIVRSSLTTEVIRSFDAALAARFPIATMKNPNEYGGNDPRQMEANNTSAFNCRKVVGNPYKQSPHSYGTSIDVNPVQNPYRDINGKWWPDNGRSYIDRSPVRSGMLTTKSTLTKKLRSYGFFWGGLWSPGKDYQHFQHS